VIRNEFLDSPCREGNGPRENPNTKTQFCYCITVSCIADQTLNPWAAPIPSGCGDLSQIACSDGLPCHARGTEVRPEILICDQTDIVLVSVFSEGTLVPTRGAVCHQLSLTIAMTAIQSIVSEKQSSKSHNGIVERLIFIF
jgi:hypothetical protein